MNTTSLITKRIGKGFLPEFSNIAATMHRGCETLQAPAIVPIQRPIEQKVRNGDVRTPESGGRLSGGVMALQ